MIPRLLLVALTAAVLLAACDDDSYIQPVVLNYWRPISDPNVNLGGEQAHAKLNLDLAQCKCGNYPINVPHNEMGLIQPDRARLSETAATKMDIASGCVTSPDAVAVECMRARGWEPTPCSGRLAVPGGTQCAVNIGNAPDYPEYYPYHGPYDQSFGAQGASPAEERRQYP